MYKKKKKGIQLTVKKKIRERKIIGKQSPRKDNKYSGQNEIQTVNINMLK